MSTKPAPEARHLADAKCETCVFKVVDFSKPPCLVCKYGKNHGRRDNYVKTDI